MLTDKRTVHLVDKILMQQSTQILHIGQLGAVGGGDDAPTLAESIAIMRLRTQA